MAACALSFPAAAELAARELAGVELGATELVGVELGAVELAGVELGARELAAVELGTGAGAGVLLPPPPPQAVKLSKRIGIAQVLIRDCMIIQFSVVVIVRALLQRVLLGLKRRG